jgi:hypothetical protein
MKRSLPLALFPDRSWCHPRRLRKAGRLRCGNARGGNKGTVIRSFFFPLSKRTRSKTATRPASIAARRIPGPIDPIATDNQSSDISRQRAAGQSDSWERSFAEGYGDGVRNVVTVKK